MSIYQPQRDTRKAFTYKGIIVQPYSSSGPFGYLMDWPNMMQARKRYWLVEDGTAQAVRVATRDDARRYIDENLVTL